MFGYEIILHTQEVVKLVCLIDSVGGSEFYRDIWRYETEISESVKYKF